jgi:O-antigen/teichoic acid export membrane protein
MLLALIVWERCEVLLLKSLCADIRQVAFYSIAFTFGNYLLLSSTIFGAAASTTIFVQLGRDKSRMPQLMASSFRYLVLTSIPLHFIAVALAAPALLLLYGTRYAGAAMVVTIAPLLCMPKAFLAPIQSLLQSAERQSYVILATVLAGIVDIGVAWTLIPVHGAVGACIGSGAAQITAVGIMWAIGIYLYKVQLPWVFLAKVASISTLAALSAHFIAVGLAPLWGIMFGGSASLVILFGLFYLLRVLEPEDQARFNLLTRSMPKSIGRPVENVISLMVRPRLAAVTPTNV